METLGSLLALMLLLGATLLLISNAKSIQSRPPILSDFDQGFRNKYVEIELGDGSRVKGEVVGVYNERPFMWHPIDRDTLSLFKCTDPALGPESFATSFDSPNAVFTVSTETIQSIKIVPLKEANSISYRQYMRNHKLTINKQPIEGETWISTAWESYHRWEDGRSNYAWDLAALNANMMSYSNLGKKLTDYAIFGKNAYLPMSGTVTKITRAFSDNPPDIVTAIDFEDFNNGGEADLVERPSNDVEISPGGPFVLRMMHFKQHSIPLFLAVGQDLPAGTFLGRVGNSGTTLVPHLHLVFGFFDQNDRYWSLPVEWESYSHRNLLAYPTGYTYGTSHPWKYGYPLFNQVCIIP